MSLFGFRDFITDAFGLSTETERRTRKKPLVERLLQFNLPSVGDGTLDPGGGMETNRGERPEGDD
jgi:hypothetical protein